jgi:DNA-binding beta-propeller fold protein YncE
MAVQLREGDFHMSFLLRPSSAMPLACAAALLLFGQQQSSAGERHLLYVGEPGIRSDVEWGGIGILVFDMDHGHKFLRRIPTLETPLGQAPEAVKGICASAKTHRIYLCTPQRMLCLDLDTEHVLWNRTYDGGCDRMAISPDGKVIYLPTLEGPAWHVIDALTGDVLHTIRPDSGSHNTIYGLDGKHAYLAGLKSPLLSVTDTGTHAVVKTVGPFSNVIRPFTINRSQTLCFVNVNERLGFEIGDINTGKVLYQVDVPDAKKGPVKRHGCPSHGIGLTPDEKQVWLSDGFNSRIHIFDATRMPPVWIASITVRDQPGWVTFSLDGRYAYPSTGEVVDTKTRQVVTTLTDEAGRSVQSEKMVEVDFSGNRPSHTGDQFGLGRAR